MSAECSAETIPPGYKKTEVGVIPEDWEIIQLSHISAFITKGSTPTTYGFKWEDSGVLFLRSECVSECGLDLTQSMFISEAANSLLRRSEVSDGDILITITGNVGRAVLLSGIDRANINQHIARVRIISPNIVPSYVFHFISQPSIRNRFNTITTGQAYPQISLKQVREAEISIPPTKAEQEAIAEALSDTDAFIESLEQLIAKKRQIKQGAMKELLTGKRRLPGFSEEWDVKRLEEFTDCTAGGTPSTKVPEYWGGTIRWMNSGELNLKRVTEVEGRITGEGLCNSSTKIIPSNCVLIGLAGQGKTRGTVAMNLVPLCTNQSIAAILPNPTFVSEYLYHNLNSRYEELRELSAGEGGRGGLNLTIIRSIIVPFPPLEEQIAVASILSDMDSEINALEEKLAKARQIKQGMMQELLTGKIRLV